MEYNKHFFEKVFSNKRMERYFALYPNDEERAIMHYQANIKLAESFYTSLSVLEVALRNALSMNLFCGRTCVVRSLISPRKTVSERPYQHRSTGFVHSEIESSIMSQYAGTCIECKKFITNCCFY